MTHTFNLQHNSSSQLGITSPVPQNLLDNALVDLASDQNYTATDATCPAPVNAQGNPTAACFSAGTNSGNSINWQLQLQYATSGGYGQIYDPNGAFLTFTTTSGQAQNHVYQNEGGRLTNIIASTTASDGSTVKDCTTAYIEGPAGGIHNSNITNQLASTNKSLYPGSYPNSRSFPSGGTLNLMAQVVVYESSGFYSQFAPPPQPPKNVDLYKLFANSNGAIAAKWPIESQLPGGISDGGSHIGLTQVMTDANQTTAPPGSTPDPNAWNWVTNAADGVNLLSGTPPSEYNDAENKIQHGTDFENQFLAQGYTPQLPQMNATQIENMALVLYGPSAKSLLTQQYYTPVCPSPGKVVKTYTCNGASWQWGKNTGGNPGGVSYADSVRAESIPQ